MIRFVVILLALFFSLGSSVFAAECTNDGNIAQPGFKLDLGCMDPLGGSHTNPAPTEWGTTILTTLLGRFADILLFAIPVIAAVSFLVAGYFYIFSAGDSEKTSKAKTIIKWNIIAMLIAFLSYGIINLIASLFTP